MSFDEFKRGIAGKVFLVLIFLSVGSAIYALVLENTYHQAEGIITDQRRCFVPTKYAECRVFFVSFTHRGKEINAKITVLHGHEKNKNVTVYYSSFNPSESASFKSRNTRVTEIWVLSLVLFLNSLICLAYSRNIIYKQKNHEN